MIGRGINILAFYIDSFVTEENAIGTCLAWALNKSLADHFLSAFLKGVAYNASTAAIAVIVLYIVVCIIYFPLYLIAYLITGFGSFMFLLFLIALLARWFSRSMTFAGSNLNLQKEYSCDYMKRFTTQVEHMAIFVSQFTATFLLLQTNKLSSNDLQILVAKIKQLESIAKEFLELLRILDSAVLIATRSTCYGGLLPNENSEISMLKSNVSHVAKQLQELLPHIEPTIQSHRNMTGTTSTSSTSVSMNNNSRGAGAGASRHQSHHRQHQSEKHAGSSLGNSDVLLLSSRLLSSAEDLRKCAFAVRPLSKAQQQQQQEQLGNAAAATGGDDGIQAILSQLTSMNSGPTGIEKLAFPIMRTRLRDQYGFEEEKILYGCDGNQIDYVYIPCKQRSECFKRQSSTSSTNSTSVASSSSPSCNPKYPLGTVIFCPPNCGFFEVLSQMPIQANWLGYYTNLGFDFVVFNYRGYSQSTGVPTPDRLKSDAEVVYRHVRQRDKQQQQQQQQQQHGYHTRKIVIHGESIGGMIACHLASKFDCDLLVCDRTFANLDAIGERMMGYWAKLGMKYIGHWFTDVVADYLTTNAPKVILQDPKDEIIANTASLKNGIANYLLFGDRLRSVASLPCDYRVAEWLGIDIPMHYEQSKALLSCCSKYGNVLAADGMIRDGLTSRLRHNKKLINELTNSNNNNNNIPVNNRLTEDFCVHVFAHVMRVCRLATRACMYRLRQRNSNSNSNSSGTLNNSSTRKHRNASNNNSNINSPNSKLPATVSAASGSNISLVLLDEADNSNSISNSSDDDTSKSSDYGEVIVDFDADDADVPNKSNSNNTNRSTERGRATAAECYNYFEEDLSIKVSPSDATELRNAFVWLSRASYEDVNLTFIERMWILISRIDGCTGQRLSDSLSNGYDSFRSWFSSYIIWTNRSSSCSKQVKQYDKAAVAESIGSTQSISMRRCVLGLTELLEDPIYERNSTAAMRENSHSNSTSVYSFSRNEEDKHIVRFLRDSFSIIDHYRIDVSRANGSTIASRAGLHDWPQPIPGNVNGSVCSGIMQCISTLLSTSQYQQLHPQQPQQQDTLHPPYRLLGAEAASAAAAAASSIDRDLELCNSYELVNSSTATTTAAAVATSPVVLSDDQVAPLVSFAGSSLPDTSIGYIIPLNTGHNGWPKDAELAQLKNVLKFAGFQVD